MYCFLKLELRKRQWYYHRIISLFASSLLSNKNSLPYRYLCTWAIVTLGYIAACKPRVNSVASLKPLYLYMLGKTKDTKLFCNRENTMHTSWNGHIALRSTNLLRSTNFCCQKLQVHVQVFLTVQKPTKCSSMQSQTK